MTAEGFIKNLASKTAGIPPPVAIRPAISPDILPDAFSSVESIQPLMPPVRKMEPTRHEPTRQVSPSTIKQIRGETPSATKSPGKAQEIVRETSDLDTPVDSEKPVPSARPVGIRGEEPAPQPKLHRAGKIENNEEIVDEKHDARPDVSTLPHDLGKESAPTSTDPDKTTQESPQEGETDTLIPETPTPAKKKDPIAQAEPESSGDIADVGPNANRIEEQVNAITAEHTLRTDFTRDTDKRIVEEHANEIAAPNTPKTGFVRQKHAVRHQVKQTEKQTYMQDEEDTVTINIGRIEVRAVFPEKQVPPAKEQQNALSLSEYLKLRAEGKL